METEEIKNQEQNQVPLEERSFIMIEFAEPGSAVFNISVNNVSPSQLLMMAMQLEWMGKDALSQMALKQRYDELQRQEMNKIAIPESSLRKRGLN